MIARILSLMLPLAALVASGAVAQPVIIPQSRQLSFERGLQGKVIVKMTRETFQRQHITPATFGGAAARYGIRQVSPWLNPKILWAEAPIYKQNGGAAKEDPRSSLARILVIEYSSLDDPERVAEAIGKMAGVEYAEPIYPRHPLYTPNDPERTKQWYLDAIKAREAWDLARADTSIIIAITDTGIDETHPDLKDALWTNPGETGDGPNGDKRFDGIDNDGDSLIDDWWGYDFGGSNGDNPDNNPTGVEEHGTIVAGVAAAEGDNSQGVVGVAFGARIMAVKVSDDRIFPNNRIYNGAAGILYAAQKHADVINCSWGGVNRSRSEEEVVRFVTNDLGVLVVAAAGNDSQESDFYPASYPGVLNVGALTEGFDKASFSNYSHRLDLSAPGTDIYSTGRGASYVYDRGTSFSAPMVTGVAALIMKRYPGTSAEKVAEILRATADDFSTTVNPAFAGKMGSGLLNARQALEVGGSIASARMVEYSIDESVPDGAADAGERIRIRVKIRNILADAPSVNATLTPVSNPSIQITGPALALGPMTSGQTIASPDSVFALTIPNTTEPNTDLVFRLTLTTKDRANDQYITIRAVPTYQTTDHNNIAVTFNSTGNIGHDGVDQQKGDGFSYDGNDDMLFHGGLMIGTDADHLDDVVRVGRLSDGINHGFQIGRPYRLQVSSDSSVETGTASFNDAHLTPDVRVGLEVEMKTYEYRAPAASKFVIVSYRINNRSGGNLRGLRCGLYLDWDVSSSSYSDQVRYDPSHRLGYQRDTEGDASTPFIGATLLTAQQPIFYAVDNYADSVNSSFYNSRKWTMLTSGIHENTTIDDMGMVIGAGPFDLANDGWTEVAFALIASQDFDSLRAAADRARTLFQPSGVVETPGAPSALAAFAQPNPFDDATVIRADAPRAGHASLVVYNLRGETVATLFDGTLDRGEHTFRLDGAQLPAGVYVYEFRSGGDAVRGKVIRQVGSR